MREMVRGEDSLEAEGIGRIECEGNGGVGLEEEKGI